MKKYNLIRILKASSDLPKFVVLSLILGSAFAYADSDGDGLADINDADPLNSHVDWTVTPEKTYQWVEISDVPTGFIAVDMNNKGHVLFRRIDYGTVIWPDVLQTTPVAKICKPEISGAGRWTDVFFKPAAFSIRGQNIKTSAITSISIPLPMTTNGSVWGHEHGLVEPQVVALGDDGSVMANVLYQYSYYNGHPEDHELSTTMTGYVFLWNPASYEICYLYGGNRGYIGTTTESWTNNWCAGFQTIQSGSSEIVSAILFDEVEYSNSLTDHELNLVKIPPYPAVPISNPIQPDRSYGLSSDFNLYPPYLEFTHLGRSLVFKESGVDWIYSVGFPGVMGYEEIDAAIWAIFEIPDSPTATSRWGLVIDDVNWSWGTIPVSMGISGVLQFDKKGTGIGDSDLGRYIWRNGTWRSLAASTSNPSSLPTGLALKKIGQTGIIWASGSAEGILVPNP